MQCTDLVYIFMEVIIVNSDRQHWRLLILGLVFGFILGGIVAGVVHNYHPKKNGKTTTVDGKKFEYWECTDQATSTDFLIAKLEGKELIIDLVDFDGKPKSKLNTKPCGVSIIETTNQYYILEDNDTGVQYMISHDLSSYRVRTFETGIPYCNKDD